MNGVLFHGPEEVVDGVKIGQMTFLLANVHDVNE